MSVKELHWGILGAGFISSWFAHDLVRNNSLHTDYHHIIESVGCSSDSKGEEFIKEQKIVLDSNYGVTPVVERYDKFFANPKVNVVYIGTPHPLHKEQVIQALEHGKNVLCEKPFTINAKDAKELQLLAKKKNLFLMEAVWTRFFPTIKNLEKLLFKDKILGDLKRLIMDFSFDAVKLPLDHRMRNNKLGGGGLVDIGMYCMTYSRILIDPNVAPNNLKFDLKSFESIDPVDKVDYVSSWLMQYENGAQLILSCSLHNDMIPNFPYLLLQGSEGALQIYGANPARPETIKVYLKNGETMEFKEDPDYHGFIYEANAVADDILLGRTTNDTVPFEETLLVMETLDKIRFENGLHYEQDD